MIILITLLFSMAAQTSAESHVLSIKILDDPQVQAAVSPALGANGTAAYWLGVCDRIVPPNEQNVSVAMVLSGREMEEFPTLMMAARASASDAYSTGRTDRLSPTEDSCRSMRDSVLADRAEKVKALLEAIQAVPR